jgi:hypothetical protein
MRSFEHKNGIIHGKLGKRRYSQRIFKASFLNIVKSINLDKNEIGRACRTREKIINAFKIEVGIFQGNVHLGDVCVDFKVTLSRILEIFRVQNCGILNRFGSE